MTYFLGVLDYKFYDKLGKGSSGLVYKAEKLKLDINSSNLKLSADNLKQNNDFLGSPVEMNKSFPGSKFPSKRESSMFIECAIKIIKLDKEKMFDRLKYEIAIMKMCKHDNIVQYYDTFKHMQLKNFH